jgi:hypothetical protein
MNVSGISVKLGEGKEKLQYDWRTITLWLASENIDLS